MIEIKNRHTGAVIKTVDADDLRGVGPALGGPPRRNTLAGRTER